MRRFAQRFARPRNLCLLITVFSLCGLSLWSAAATAEEPPRVLFLGDSLTAGYGLGEEQAFPALVAEAMAEAGRPIEAVNAGVSGDTTAGGLARLEWLLRLEPDVVVVGLGGNDGLRGLDPEMTEANLRRIVEKAKASGAAVVLLGMRMPPNYGEYAERFAALYPRLAAELEVALVPFLLEGVGGDPSLNLPDGIHPNPEGQRRLAETVEPVLASVLRDAERADR
ncbi:MAG: arylesterase [Thermoanaerobaculia bacterium]|nr:arylesterase [Thermoanaerobaculia bacterium]